MSDIIGYEYEDRGSTLPLRRHPKVRCGCGAVVVCDDSWANECGRCGTEFNGSGQRLNPRSMWGEETGEVF